MGFIGPNMCSNDPGRHKEIRAAATVLEAEAVMLGLWLREPRGEIRVCAVDSLPGVACASVGLAGCVLTTKPPWIVLVTTRPPNGGDWYSLLLHELIGALVLDGVLDLPRTEAEFIRSDQYKALLRGARERLR